VAFTYLKVKSANCLCLLPVVLVLVLRIWSRLHHWSSHVCFIRSYHCRWLRSRSTFFNQIYL